MLELEVLGVSSDGEHQPVVLLRNEDRLLPIMVGLAEAEAIHYGLAKVAFPRPMTHDLVCNLLAGLRGDIKSVAIYKLENDTFFAQLNIEQKNADGQIEQILRVDSRPSDGIAIAVRAGCPVFAAEDVMDKAGQDISLLQTDDEDDEEGGDDEEE